MPLEVALRELDLTAESATADKVERAFKRKAHDAHPDHGATRDTWDRLEEARRVALANFGEAVGGALEVRTLRELVVANQAALNQARRKEETADTKRSVVRRRTSAVTSAKRRAWAITALGAAGTALYKLLQALLRPVDLPVAPIFDQGTVIVTISLAAVGAAGILLKLYADRIEQAVEDLTAELADSDTFRLLLDEISTCCPDYLGPGRWCNRSQFETGVAIWIEHAPRRLQRILLQWMEKPLLTLGLEPPPLASIARRVRVADATRLILAKGVEVGILEQRRDQSATTKYAWVFAGDPVPLSDDGVSGLEGDRLHVPIEDHPREHQSSAS